MMYARFEVLRAVQVLTAIFFVTTPCERMYGYIRSGGRYRLHIQGRNI
jgi:hypothetical protein